MPVQTIKARRLYQQIADQIGGLIRNQEFLPGERLPPERVLAQRLGVSRPSVREAMIALELAGLVEVRTGSGTYVRSTRRQESAASEDAGPGPFEWVQARKLLEGEIAAAAARTITDGQLAGLRDAVTVMEEENAQGSTAELGDRSFHVGIAEATRNTVLVAIEESIWDCLRGPLWARINRIGLTPEYRALWVRDHLAVLDRLSSHDARGARVAMHRHLTHVERALLSG
jgi:DNA-binding FadR family transcriptional regulator